MRRLIGRIAYRVWLWRFTRERDHCTGYGEKPITWKDRIPPDRGGKRFDDSRVRVKVRELPRPKRPLLKKAMA